MTPLSAIGVAWAAMAVVMSVIWGIQVRTHNAGIVDVVWSIGTGLSGVWFALVGNGDPTRRLVTGILVGLWGARLGIALLTRMIGAEEDGRYKTFRDKWGDQTQVKMFGFFQIQAFWAVLFALPVLAAASNPSAFGILDLCGIAVWVLAIGGESVADAQLEGFRRDATHKGQVCKVGLWSWSRHPNYFFEWIHWFAYILLAAGGPLWWLAWVLMAVMFVFLTRVTGIPMTEAQALLSRGDAYREYQRTVSVFFPVPPKRSDAK